MEAVEEGAFTEVLMSAKGKIVRADFKLVDTPEPWRIVWSQQVENTPFERVLKSAQTDIRIADGHGSHGPLTVVTIELRQTLQGFRGGSLYKLWYTGFARFGSPLVLRAATATVVEALDGLERIAGGGAP